MKKTVAFVLILMCVLACVFITSDDFIVSALLPNQAEISSTQYALTLDSNGVVYYVENRGGVNRILKMDDIGNVIVDEELALMQDGERFLVQNMYVTADKAIIVSGFEVDKLTRQASRAIAVMLEENGAYVTTVFDKEILPSLLRGGRQSALFSAMSEDDSYVYLSYLNEGQVDVLSLDKLNPGLAQSVGHYVVDANVNAMYISAEQQLLLSMADGSMLISANNNNFELKPLSMDRRLHCFQFFHSSSGSPYVVDAENGGVYQLSIDQGSLSRISGGDTQVADGEELRFAQFSQVAVGPRGKLAGSVQQAEGQTLIYTGSESRMTSTQAVSVAVFNSDRLILLAVVVGAILLSVLIWDVYCHLMKMRLSVLLRQAILVGMSLLIMVYVLMNVIIEPQMSEKLNEQFQNQVDTAARVLAHDVAEIERETAVEMVEGASYALSVGEGQSLPVYLSLIQSGETPRFLASNEGSVRGLLLRSLAWQTDLADAVHQAAETGSAFLSRVEPLGDNVYAVVRVDDSVVAVASMNVELLSESLLSITQQIRSFLIIVGVVLFLGLLAVESITIRSIQRLRKGVDAVSAGNYDVQIRASSGDEVENLAHAFNAMAAVIKENTRRLGEVNRSYYRFVPENLVQLLGETSIEKVGKSSYVEKHMVVMTLHFSFSDRQATSSTEELFRNINNVIEHLSPVVTSCGGTVYDFNPEGFVAVFPSGREAMQAGLRIREAAKTLDEKRAAMGMCLVDVRLVMSGGDVMLGIVGDEKRMAPTVVSDVIDVTKQLGQTQRPSGVYVLCTEDVVRGMKGYRMRYIGRYELDGRFLELYDVYDGDPYALLKTKEMYAPVFAQAIEQYYAGNLSQARLLFMQIVKSSMEDGVARNYLYCADTLMKDVETKRLSYKVS